MVGAIGFEPMTPSMSPKCSTAELRARYIFRYHETLIVSRRFTKLFFLNTFKYTYFHENNKIMKNNSVINFENNLINSSLILSSPHSGNFYPDEFISLLNVELSELNQNEDSLVDELINGSLLFKNLILKAIWSRSVVDVNRAKTDFNFNDFEPPISDIIAKPSKYSRSGIGVIPTRSGINDKIYKSKLSGKKATRWINDAWKSYHETLSNILDRAYDQYGQYVLFDFHSMPSESDNIRNKVDIILGNCHGQSCDENVIDFLEKNLSAKGLKTRRNTPYSGGFITENYGDPKKNKHTIQIEINRSIYLDEKTRERNNNFENCKLVFCEMINEFEKNKNNLLG